jgi:radical SAM superfamily enzyme YgiQ (UPF0313 family)
MRIHLFAGARPWERPNRPVRHAFRGQGLANLTLPGLAALIPRHHEIRLQDEQVAPVDLDGPIDLAMVTTKACYTPRAYEIADALRERGVPVVIGGCHASLNPEEAAEHADAVVEGEAESVMPALLEDAARGRLEPRYKGSQADMAQVPVPRRDLLQKRYITDSLIVSRGCNYSCRFCCIRGFYGPGFRAKPVGQVVEEVRGLGTYMSFLDENLVSETDYALELFEALAPLKRRWLAQVSADIVQEPRLIEAAARGGARGFHIGFESLNPTNLAAEGKRHNVVEAYQELVDRLRHAGIMLAAGIMFGLDDDTPDAFAQTIETLLKMGVDLAYFKMATPYPGTPFYKRINREGRILTHDWSYYDGCFPVFRPHKMTARQLLEGTIRARSDFYSKRALLGRLRGYTHLRIPFWASLNLNRLAKVAYRHTEVLGDRFLREVGE